MRAFCQSVAALWIHRSSDSTWLAIYREGLYVWYLWRIDKLPTLVALGWQQQIIKFFSPEFKTAGENITLIFRCLAQEIDFDSSPNFCSIWSHPKSHLISVKHGGVLVLLHLQHLGNHIGANARISWPWHQLTAHCGIHRLRAAKLEVSEADSYTYRQWCNAWWTQTWQCLPR